MVCKSKSQNLLELGSVIGNVQVPTYEFRKSWNKPTAVNPGALLPVIFLCLIPCIIYILPYTCRNLWPTKRGFGGVTFRGCMWTWRSPGRINVHIKKGMRGHAFFSAPSMWGESVQKEGPHQESTLTTDFTTSRTVRNESTLCMMSCHGILTSPLSSFLPISLPCSSIISAGYSSFSLYPAQWAQQESA